MTRRVPPAPEFAVPLRVQQMWEAFEYPDDLGGGGPVAPTGGGGAPTVVIAAADAQPIEKTKADFICTGATDEGTIGQAIDLLHGLSNSRGGRILLSSGTFECTGDIQVVDKIFLQGMGRYETILHTTQAAGNFIGMGTDGGLRDLTVFGESFTQPDALVETYNTGCLIENVLFSRGAIGIIDTGGGETTIRGCNSEFVPIFFDGRAGSQKVTISQSIVNAAGHGIGRIFIGPDGNHWIITDNMLSGQINSDTGGTGPNGVVIVGNVWTGVDGPDDAVVNLHGLSSLVFAANSVPDADGFDFIDLDTCHGAIVANNSADDITAGILLDTCDNALVIGNVLGFGETEYLGEYGIHVIDGDGSVIVGNVIVNPGQDANNTHDGILLSGDSDRNYIHGNRIAAPAAGNEPRYGINISAGTCNDNTVFGNMLGPAAGFGTAAYNDGGTGTITTPDGNGQFTY